VNGYRIGLTSQFFGGSISGESALRAGEGNRTLASGDYRGGSLNQEAIYGPRLLWVSEVQVMLLNDPAKADAFRFRVNRPLTSCADLPAQPDASPLPIPLPQPFASPVLPWL
jgi:hypothetical protein